MRQYLLIPFFGVFGITAILSLLNIMIPVIVQAELNWLQIGWSLLVVSTVFGLGAVVISVALRGVQAIWDERNKQ